jgi:hypothetical protein
MSIDELDQEIREIEARIARERIALEQAVNSCTNSVRDAATSPGTLMALLGLGYGIGKLMFGGGKASAAGPVPKAAGMVGLLTGVVGTALSIMQPRLGVGSIARWAAKRAFAPRKPAGPPNSSPERVPGSSY